MSSVFLVDLVSQKIMYKLKLCFFNIGKNILFGFINNSYWIFLWCAIIAIMLYVIGVKKAGKYITISMMAHLILQMLRGVIK